MFIGCNVRICRNLSFLFYVEEVGFSVICSCIKTNSYVTIVPAMLKINSRVKKKNFNPDNDTELLTISLNSRFDSVFHESAEMERKIQIGFVDSSLIRAANNDTANVRIIRKTSEYQK